LNSEAVERREEAGALWVRLKRPPVNVLDVGLIQALDTVLLELAQRRDLKVLVLESALDGVFSAGVDVAAHAREHAAQMLKVFHGLLRRIDALPQVALAAVDGSCLGGGCELAASCDVVLATPRARFGQPEIDLGCFPPAAAVLLPRLVGRAAFELVLGGAPISAAEAARIGLVTRVVRDLAGETRAWVDRLAAKSGASLALARRALRDGGFGVFGEALSRAEALYRERLLATHDAEEGVRAFIEKRKPKWQDA
jgi:cyclohexa-1,5-dienecarbonyl-CoA hydratase